MAGDTLRMRAMTGPKVRPCLAGHGFMLRMFLTLLLLQPLTALASSAPRGWLSPPQIPLFGLPGDQDDPTQSPDTQDHEFTLRHILHHGVYEHPSVVRMNLQASGINRASVSGPDDEPHGMTSFSALSAPQQIQRLSDRSISGALSRYSAARENGRASTLEFNDWSVDKVSGPSMTDKRTVVNLAKISWNAYMQEPWTGDWQHLNGSHFNHSESFGWKSDGLRGHIYADKDNSTIIISLKGTSPAVFDGAETTTNDKVNDNLFFACCCGQGGQYLWHQVCDCMPSAYTCNATCVVSALREENRYYASSIELYGNVTEMYPNADVWLVGHSLGGSTSALLGLTFGLPVATFEAPGEALAAARLGIPSPPGAIVGAPQTRKMTGAYHFGHTADPIFMGSCNAATSACTLGGYAMQTQCHTGHVCIYDTVEDKKWRVGAGYHRIRGVIEDVLEDYDEVAECVPDNECVDCFNWKYFESNHSETTTATTLSPTSTTTRKRTTTCQTPGWWGCLDETTTTPSSSPPSTTGPTTSCVKHGWFGGCIETTTVMTTNRVPSSVPTAVVTTTCANYGWLGGCKSTSTLTVFPTACVEHGWFGRCKETSPRGPEPAAVAVGPTVTTTRPLPITTHIDK